MKIEFIGWVNSRQRDELFRESHLLILPSIWPEPFGQVGVEAGHHGLPSAAFSVGGIPEWLQDGMNGHLAPGDPPRADGLAGAIVRCLKDAGDYRRLSLGAEEAAGRFSRNAHMERLEPLLRECGSGQRI
jgi:glycosyltransferase involved in cell wall biosynthesis